MTIQRALILGICLILSVVAFTQLLSLWWLQQQLQQEITKQSGQLSKIVLARTAEKMQRNSKVISGDAEQVPAENLKVNVPELACQHNSTSRYGSKQHSKSCNNHSDQTNYHHKRQRNSARSPHHQSGWCENWTANNHYPKYSN